MSEVNVVCAVSINKRGVFLARRKSGKSFAGFWEFPGGKVGNGESFYNALIRELREELGIESKIKSFIAQKPFFIEGNKYILHAYHVEFLDEPSFSTDHDMFERFPLEKLISVKICPNDVFILKDLVLE